MSDEKDPQRISDSADNCEVLRARLAKYEDAEGRPVGLSIGQAELVGLVRDLALRSGKAASPVMHAAAIALESQDREIEDWKRGSKAEADAGDAVRAELAALKSQPNGVVLPERDDRAAYEAFYTERAKTLPLPLGNSPLRYSGGQYINDFALFGWMVWEACLSEVARLNSSSVSAGDDAQYPPCDYCAEPLSYHPWHGSGLINGVESRHIHACDKCRHLLPTVSAGEYGDAYQGAREDLAIWKRRALEAETKVREQDQIIENLGNALNDENGPTFMGEPVLKARPALSAPSHGEQVRKVAPKQARKTWRAGNPSYLCHHCNTPLMMHEKQVYCPEGPAFASNSTAAPSAGSQKEQE